jgi:hypothetical protein
MQRAGRISFLRRQVGIPIVVKGIRVCSFVADFVYVMNGRRIVEDVKSKYTRTLPVYRLKKKLLAALGIEITEVV